MLRFFIACHRYLGFAGWILFVLWFLSGFFMIYVEMPYLQLKPTALDFHRPLRIENEHLNFQQAFARSELTSPPRQARLTMLQGRPVYRFMPEGKGAFVSVYADTGERLEPIVKERALNIARDWRPESRDARFLETLNVDQWTLYSSDFPRHRPLHKFTAADDAGTEIYVSSVTGMIVQATTREERLVAWVGPVTHWIYPTFIRSRPALWSWVVLVLSGFCILLALSGIIAGLYRMRLRRANGSIAKNVSPFADVWMRWHHIVGLLFAVPVFTWIFSGFLSMTPGDWAPSRGASVAEQKTFAGSQGRGRNFIHPAVAIQSVQTSTPGSREIEQSFATSFTASFTTKEIDLIYLDGTGYYLLHARAGRTLLVHGETGALRSSFAVEDIEKAAARFKPESRVSLLNEFDSYYYNRPGAEHGLLGLPAFRIDLENDTRTTFYVDARTGRIARRMERRSRWNRWLYNGLHSLDFPFLIERPGLRLTLLWVGLLGGTFLSLTGLILTVNWVRRRFF